MANVYYVGDWAIMLGPVFAETPFNYAHKGTQIYNYAMWLKEAIESSGEHRVTSVPTWDFYRMRPGELEQVIDQHDVLVFSDVEAKNFQLAPEFFDRNKFGNEPLTFPDRVRLIVDAIHSGKHAMFLGGWLSFTGEMGKGGWGRTNLQSVLPVECLDFEDLRESTEGYTGRAAVPGHPILRGVDISKAPPILGYNIVRPRENCQVVATWEQTDDPMLATGQFGKGRVIAYTSDPAPHWGCNFVYWNQYPALWSNAISWLLSEAGGDA
jgi:uncharacterized membrane protein